MKRIVLIISVLLGCTQQNDKCLDVVVANDTLKIVEVHQADNKTDIHHIASTCDCYHDWDSVLLLNPLLVDSTTILSAVKINKNFSVQKIIYGVFQSPNRIQRQHPVKSDSVPSDPEQLKMEICAINREYSVLDDKYSEEDVVSYLRIVKYQSSDSIVHEGINLPNYFTEIRNFY